MPQGLILVLALGVLSMSSQSNLRHDSDLAIGEFDRGSFGTWVAQGDAFGSAPVNEAEAGRLEIVNSGGAWVISSERNGDAPQGDLTSPLFEVKRDYISFRIGGGDYERHCCLELWLDGRIVKSATGRNTDRLMPQSWDVRSMRGRTVHIRIVDHASGDWGHINVGGLCQTDQPESRPVVTEPLYKESLRPQFHFTARQHTMDRLNPGMRQEGWINDLNGLVYYEGEYHLFAQRWHKCWLHAVSRDLVHWTELDPAFWADDLDGGVQSGTCVIDYGNTSGLSNDPAIPAMVAFWSNVENNGQCIHFSLDRGRTWQAYRGNPVLNAAERDPKVFWHEATRRWVMLLYSQGSYHFYTSSNLREWKDEKSEIPDCFECPDFFELPVEGKAQLKKWVLVHGDGRYSVGSFDGGTFLPETDRLVGDIGPNFYATQSWENTKTGDGRRIQAAWMRGSDFPNMPFSQQISFPCELRLMDTPAGLRVFRHPIKEIELLQGKAKHWEDFALEDGQTLPLVTRGEQHRLTARLNISPGAELKIWLRGMSVTLGPKRIESGSASSVVPSGVRTIEILLDSGSIEAFVNDGEVSSTRYVLPGGQGISIEAVGGTVVVESLDLFELKSAWTRR